MRNEKEVMRTWPEKKMAAKGNQGCFVDKNVYCKITPQKGKGLYAKDKIREGEHILMERPLICCQFSWNSLYKYVACNHCLRSLETAEEMARRLSGNIDLQLPFKECCGIEKNRCSHTKCPACSVCFFEVSNKEILYHDANCFEIEMLRSILSLIV